MSSNRSADGAETRSEASRAGEQPVQRASEAAGQQGQVETPEELGDDGPDELLIGGQEEVFSRTEIESGRSNIMSAKSARPQCRLPERRLLNRSPSLGHGFRFRPWSRFLRAYRTDSWGQYSAPSGARNGRA